MSLTEIDSQNDVSGQEKMSVFSRLLRLSSLGTKIESPTSSSPKEQDSSQTYYGVYIPCESKISPDEEILLVYKDKNDALKIVKKYKKARFKAFRNHHDAVAFALQGIEPSTDKDSNHIGENISNDNASQSNLTFIGGEKPSQFKGPKPQDMVAFRKTIEAGDFESVKKTVWENPRYLVSSGDTPSILQEGSRYNALHVAVKAQNVQMCDFILATISDPQFIQLLYGDDNIDSCKERAVILLDLYLNTPDKAINDTPLHFASKFGAKDVVDLLVSYPQCHKNRINKYSQQPKDIICQRCNKSDPHVIAEIASMLEDRFYVPVLHSEDDSKQPIIGEPFSPGSPPALNHDPISPRMEIRAFAGPMNKDDAQTFRKKWKTPPRSLTNSIYKNHIAEAKFRLHDVEKGLEKVGRNLAQQMRIGWKEYWPFLDTFTDLTTIEGLGYLEDYLKNKFASQWNNSSSNESFGDSLQMTPKTPIEKCKETRRFIENVSEKTPNKGSSALSPMSDLCVALKSLSMNDVNRKNSPNYSKYQRIPDSKNNPTVAEDDAIVNSFLNPGLNPYLCVEKSCQVFAKRLGLGFSHALTAENEFITECLKSEMKHLQQTISSYMDDARFHSVDFHLLHSRVAQLVAQKLKFDNEFNDDFEILRKELTEISKINLKNGDTYSSDEDENIFSFRHSKKNDRTRKKNYDVNMQIKCIASNILQWLSDSSMDNSSKTLKTEEKCVEIWSDLQKCNCSWQSSNSSRNNRKNASFKRNLMKNKDGYDILSSSPKSTLESVSKRLMFEGDDDQISSISNSKSDKNHNLSSNDNAHDLLKYKIKNNFRDTETDSQSSDELFKDIYSSDDEAKTDTDEEKFLTPLSNSCSDSDLSFHEIPEDFTNSQKDIQTVYIFINGDKPTKTDKAVFDAICNCDIDFTKYPYVYRWRHTISLYSYEERESWPVSYSPPSVELDSPITCSFNIGYIPNYDASSTAQKNLRNMYTMKLDENISSNLSKNNGSVINPITLMTPTKNNLNVIKTQSMMSPKPSMQVSKWMRVTGPNSPKLSSYRYYGPNVSVDY